MSIRRLEKRWGLKSGIGIWGPFLHDAFIENHHCASAAHPRNLPFLLLEAARSLRRWALPSCDKGHTRVKQNQTAACTLKPLAHMLLEFSWDRAKFSRPYELRSVSLY